MKKVRQEQSDTVDWYCPYSGCGIKNETHYTEVRIMKNGGQQATCEYCGKDVEIIKD